MVLETKLVRLATGGALTLILTALITAAASVLLHDRGAEADEPADPAPFELLQTDG